MQIVAEEKVREDLDSEAEGPRDDASQHWRMSFYPVLLRIVGSMQVLRVEPESDRELNSHPELRAEQESGSKFNSNIERMIRYKVVDAKYA